MVEVTALIFAVTVIPGTQVSPAVTSVHQPGTLSALQQCIGQRSYKTPIATFFTFDTVKEQESLFFAVLFYVFEVVTGWVYQLVLSPRPDHIRLYHRCNLSARRQNAAHVHAGRLRGRRVVIDVGACGWARAGPRLRHAASGSVRQEPLLQRLRRASGRQRRARPQPRRVRHRAQAALHVKHRHALVQAALYTTPLKYLIHVCYLWSVCRWF